jgi:hypothetical protein
VDNELAVNLFNRVGAAHDTVLVARSRRTCYINLSDMKLIALACVFVVGARPVQNTQAKVQFKHLSDAQIARIVKRQFPDAKAFLRSEVQTVRPGASVTGVRIDGLSSTDQIVIVSPSPCAPNRRPYAFDAPYNVRPNGNITCKDGTHPVVRVTKSNM